MKARAATRVPTLKLLLALSLVATAAASDVDGILMHYLSKSSFGRGRAIDLIVNEYTTESSSEEGTKMRLYKALEAMRFAETDGEPVPVHGYDFLFIGSVGASLNEGSLRHNGITHIIDWSETARCNVFDGIEYLCTTLNHNLDHLDEAVDFVEQARQSGGSVLSHCWHGKNRSVTLIAAYLIKYEGMTAEEATDLIRLTRPQAEPWWGDLEHYSKYCLKASRVKRAQRDQGEDWEDGARERHLRGQ